MKPCPFCGSSEVSTSKARRKDGVVTHQYIECHNCGACGPFVETLEGDPVGPWNERPTP